MRRRWTDEMLIEAVKKEPTVSAVARALGLKAEGGNFRTIKIHMKRLGLTTEHMSGRGWLKGKTHNWAKKRSLEDVLVENSSYNSTALRKRVIREKLIPSVCSICKLTDWLDQSISLHLDHISGVNDDNRIENLRFLCPNCHSQTSTYCGRNQAKARLNKANPSKAKAHQRQLRYCNNCVDCNVAIVMRAKRCNKCSHLRYIKIDWPPSSELLIEVKETSYCAAARRLGVSDSAVRKRIKNHP